MQIKEETRTDYKVECDCGTDFDAMKDWGVIECPNCSDQRDPRQLRYKWARHNDPLSNNACQAL